MSGQLWEHSLLVQKWYHVTKNPPSMLIFIINPQQQFCALRQPLKFYIKKNALVKREFWNKLLRQSWAVVEWYVEWYAEWYAPPAGFNSGASLILSEYKKPVSIQHSLAIYTGERGGGAHKEQKPGSNETLRKMLSSFSGRVYLDMWSDIPHPRASSGQGVHASSYALKF